MCIMCEFCKEKKKEVDGFIYGYGSKYTQETLDSLYKLRDEICVQKKKCNRQICYADKLLNMIDNNEIIKKKKGI